MAAQDNKPSVENPIFKAHLRIARPTQSIAALLPFYIDGLGFQNIGSFDKHNGFDGIMLGHPSIPYHLEFTKQENHDPGRAPTQDNLLVFYLPDQDEWSSAVGKMQRAGFEAVKSWNPYWEADGKGRTFEDADGYRVVLWNGEWRAF
ncbi:Glyoxalase/Bleomycin resistance protein/Dihydroxybiphenyl dioxygenase [Pyrenochaeta sp. MPI-SDFR-AT-0127]|nr:Glyoxalase/Bleomycin resistance protein/Dihydroxybiphenyl dioxygenase [Pyrenochaeta sp. MPI-SDFR-AT-0127]